MRLDERACSLGEDGVDTSKTAGNPANQFEQTSRSFLTEPQGARLH